MNKDGHAFMIFGFCLDAGLGACTGAGTFPGGSGLGPGCYGDRLSGSAKLEISTCEFIVGPFVLKKTIWLPGFSALHSLFLSLNDLLPLFIHI